MMNQRERQRFLAARREGVGSSDVAAIVGQDRYKTALDVWLEKRGQHPDEDVTSPAMEAGIRLEPVVLEWTADERRLALGRFSPAWAQPMKHPDHEWARANPDAYCYEAGDRDDLVARWESGALIIPHLTPQRPDRDWGVMEAKAPGYWSGRRNPDDWGEGQAPIEAVLQITWQMGVLGWTWGIVCGLIGGQQLRHVRVDFDAELFDMLLDRADQFWHKHVLASAPPPLRGPDQRLLEHVYEISADSTAMLADLPTEPPDRQRFEFLHREYMRRRKVASAAKDLLDYSKFGLAEWFATHDLEAVLTERPGRKGVYTLASWKRPKATDAKHCACGAEISAGNPNPSRRIYVAETEDD
jgi:hypothetical protein